MDENILQFMLENIFLLPKAHNSFLTKTISIFWPKTFYNFVL